MVGNVRRGRQIQNQIESPKEDPARRRKLERNTKQEVGGVGGGGAAAYGVVLRYLRPQQPGRREFVGGGYGDYKVRTRTNSLL